MRRMTSLEYSDDVMVLKSVIQEKDKVITHLEQEMNKIKALKEMEERLMTVAVHNMV